MGCTGSSGFLRSATLPGETDVGRGYKVILKHKKRGLVGLKNLGNTCFMNSALQCLSNTPPLVDFFLENDWKHHINRKNPMGNSGEVAECFGELIRLMWLDDRDKPVNPSGPPIVSPHKLKHTLGRHQPQFSGNDQQDAQELLAFLLDGLHEDLNRVKTKPYVEDVESDGTKDEEAAAQSWRGYLLRNRSIIVDLSQGQLRSTLRCLTCNSKSVKFETFMYLSVPIVRKKGQKVSLQRCIKEFCKPELLTGDCRWNCPNCKEKRDAEKEFALWTMPNVLIVHLKRFEYDDYGRRTKINSQVDFPLANLDLSPFVPSKPQDPPIYNLYGVSNHHGGIHGGHYTAAAMNRIDRNWYLFNDSVFNKIEESQVCTSSAYVLFFQKASNNQSIRPASTEFAKGVHAELEKVQDALSSEAAVAALNLVPDDCRSDCSTSVDDKVELDGESKVEVQVEGESKVEVQVEGESKVDTSIQDAGGKELAGGSSSASSAPALTAGTKKLSIDDIPTPASSQQAAVSSSPESTRRSPPLEKSPSTASSNASSTGKGGVDISTYTPGGSPDERLALRTARRSSTSSRSSNSSRKSASASASVSKKSSTIACVEAEATSERTTESAKTSNHNNIVSSPPPSIPTRSRTASSSSTSSVSKSGIAHQHKTLSFSTVAETAAPNSVKEEATSSTTRGSNGSEKDTSTSTSTATSSITLSLNTSSNGSGNGSGGGGMPDAARGTPAAGVGKVQSTSAAQSSAAPSAPAVKTKTAKPLNGSARDHEIDRNMI